MKTELVKPDITDIPELINILWNEGTIHDLFYNVEVNKESLPRVLTFMEAVHVNMFVILHKDKPGGLVWFDNINQASARIHMVGFKWTWGRTSLRMGRHVLEIATRMFPTIIGNTPTHLNSMVAYLKRCGMEEVATIPKALYVATLNKNVDMLISKISRKDIN